MKIIVLNGSPRPSGNTKAMISAFTEGAERAGHEVTVFDVCRMNIKGCLACEYCHTKAFRQCVQKDDMQKIYPVLDEAEMIVLASPIYYHGLSGQLQSTINRIYAQGYPKKLKKAMLLLSSGDHGVYDGAIFTYRNSFLEYLHLEDMGIFTAAGDENKSDELLTRIREAGAAITDPDDHNVPRLVIRSGNVTVKAKMNDSFAARDFMNRLPMTVQPARIPAWITAVNWRMARLTRASCRTAGKTETSTLTADGLRFSMAAKNNPLPIYDNYIINSNSINSISDMKINIKNMTKKISELTNTIQKLEKEIKNKDDIINTLEKNYILIQK